MRLLLDTSVCIDFLRRHGPTVERLMAYKSRAAEKMASVLTIDYLRREAAQGKRRDFERFLSLAPDAPAQAGDALVQTATARRTVKPKISRKR